jgi:hypothetical protein
MFYSRLFCALLHRTVASAKTIPPANTDRLSGTGDLALDLLVGLFLLGLLLGPSLILFLLLSLLLCSQLRPP